jgi:hypothetical protein
MQERSDHPARNIILAFGLRTSASLLLAATVGCAPSPDDAEGPGRWGVRVGAILPGEALEDYSSSVTMGAYYTGRIPAGFGPREVPFEVGLDVSTSKSNDGRVETVFWTAHLGMLLFHGAHTPESGLYFLGGYSAILASSEVDGKFGYSEWILSLDLGVGAVPAASGWDFRITYSSPLASKNLKDLVQLTAGYRF